MGTDNRQGRDRDKPPIAVVDAREDGRDPPGVPQEVPAAFQAYRGLVGGYRWKSIPMTETTADNRGDCPVGGIVLILKRIVFSREPVMVTFRGFIVFIATVAGFKNMHMWWESLSGIHMFKKDFLQEFLFSKSVLEGVDPYLPLPILAGKFLGPLPHLIFPHPTPHPPPVALLCLPLGWMSYEHAVSAWFLFELICIFISVAMLLRWVGVQRRTTLASLSALMVLVWTPITYELVFGQLNAFLFVFMVIAWQALRSGKDIRGGIFLGTAIAVKLIPWPLIIFLLLRRNWRATCSAITTTVAANVVVAMLIGFDRMAHYYLKVGSSVSGLYHAHHANISLSTIGWRIFLGMGSPVLDGVNAPPLFHAPAIAPYISIAIPFAMLLLGLLFAFKARNFDTSFGILTCLMILVSPVAWPHYLVLALIPFAIVLRNLSSLNWPGKETNATLAIFIAFFIPLSGFHELATLLAGNGYGNGLVQRCSFTVALVFLTPAIALLGLLWLLRRLDRLTPQMFHASG